MCTEHKLYPRQLGWERGGDSSRAAAREAQPTAHLCTHRFGPRQSEIKLGFTDIGRLNCEVKLTSFAASRLSEAEQVGGLTEGMGHRARAT